MPDSRTPSKWTYRAAKPVRSRVVKRPPAERAGVRRHGEGSAALITPRQARFALYGVMAAIAMAGAWWMYQSPYVTVHEIRVDGASRLSEQAIIDAANIGGASAFRVDLGAAERRVEALPGVRDASIEKHGWTAATITVQERAVWGSWQIDGTNVPIDAEGYVLDGVQAPEGAPLIIEVEPQRALAAGDRLDAGAVELAARLVKESQTAFGRQVLALAYRQNAGLTAVLSGATVDDRPLWVTFGDSRDYDYKVAALYVLLEQARAEDLDLKAVDLRFGSRLSFN